MFSISVAIVSYCLISKAMANNLLKLIADPSLPDELFCTEDLIKPFSSKILFDGDSTVKMLYFQLLMVLGNSNCYSALTTSKLKPVNDTNLEYKRVWSRNIPHDFINLEQFLRLRFDGEYNIIIWNQGMHLLHIFPERTIENLFLIRNFNFLMTLVMESVPDSTRCVIFRTTNAITTSKYYGEYSKYAKLYNAHEKNTIRKCMAEYQDYEACESAIFTNKGAKWLNRKMRQFVAKYKSEHLKKDRPKLVLLDAYSLYVNKSKYTEDGDGRHYRPIVNLEIALLKDTIENKC